MSMRSAILGAAAAVALATAGMGCTSKDTTYCDEQTPCTDPDFPQCNLSTKTCEQAPETDAGADGARDAAPDLRPGDGGQTDTSLAGDAGCESPRHQCAGYCFELNDPAHCGPGCLSCGGETPACDGAGCGCTEGSCADAQPICDAQSGACRACGGHAECAQRDAQKPVCVDGTCHESTCGDRYIDVARGERCDDGNHDNGDGCDPTCRYTGTVTTIAGKAGTSNGNSYCDDIGTDARLREIGALATSPRGFVFGDSIRAGAISGAVVRELSLPSLAVTTLAGDPVADEGSTDGQGGAARFTRAAGAAADWTYAYVSDGYTIRRIRFSDGMVTTIAGAPGAQGTADGNPGTSARFTQPGALALYSGGGKLYVIDRCAIRVVDLTSTAYPVSTLAGSVTSCAYADGTGAAARFSNPRGVAAIYGGVYVADYGNHVVRLVADTGAVTTPFGSAGVPGTADGVGSGARFSGPAGIAYNASNGRLLVAEGSCVLRLLDPTAVSATTIAGGTCIDEIVDGTGSAVRFGWGYELGAIAPFGSDFLVANSVLLRRVTTAGVVTTIVGAKTASGTADGVGTGARFKGPFGILALGADLLVADSYNKTLRRLSAGQVVTTVAGTPGSSVAGDGVGASATFTWPGGLALNNDLVYLVDETTVREFAPTTAAVVTRAGSAMSGFTDGNGIAAQFYRALTIATDGAFLYVGQDCALRRVSLGAPWSVLTMFGTGTFPGSCPIQDGTGAAGSLGSRPSLLVVGTDLWVGDYTVLRKVDLTTGPPYTITTIAGQADQPGHVDGTGLQTQFSAMLGLAWDGTSIFVLDDEVVRQVEPGTTRVTTLAGRPGCRSAIDGNHARAAFGGNSDLTYSPATSNLYLVDGYENVVREIR